MGSFTTGIIKDENSPFNMNVYLEKMYFFPGDTIKGLIQLNSINNINQRLILSSKICFVLKGIEYWENNQNNNNSNRETPNPSLDEIQKKVIHQNDRKQYYEYIIFSKEELIQNLMEASSKINTISFNKNEINIPILIEIPKEAKSSLEWSKENNIFCFSRTIFSINIPELRIFSNYFIFIQKICPFAISGININKIIGKKSTLFFWENDNIKIDAYLKQDSYAISDFCNIQLKIDTSELKSVLNSIVLTLKRKIKLLVNGKQSVFLNTGDYIEDLWEKKIILEKNETNYSFEFNIPILDNEKIIKQKNFIYELRNFNKKYLTYLIPSYSGNMIKSEYFIKLKTIFDDNKIVYNDFIIPFEIYHCKNSFSKEAMNEINKIFFEINKMKGFKYCDKNNINNYTGYSSSVNPSLPDEEMIKRYYSSEQSCPPVGEK